MRVRSTRHTEDIAASNRLSDTTAKTRRAVRVLTESEAAQFIGMSAAWLKKSRTKRFRAVMDAPPFIRAGVKRVVYRIEDLETWQERHLEHVGPTRDQGDTTLDSGDSERAIT